MSSQSNIFIRSLFISSISLERFRFTELKLWMKKQGDLQQLNDQGQQARTSLLVLPYLLFLSQKTKGKHLCFLINS